jgi:hypothetical protein
MAALRAVHQASGEGWAAASACNQAQAEHKEALAMSADILSLSWQIQAALASGYAAYMISYTGIRTHHRAVEITFITLVFSLIATLAILFIGADSPPIAIACAFITSIFAGLLWRGWGRDLYWKAMRKLDFTWSNDDPSALATLAGNARYPVTQIAVLLDDGTWLRCDDATKFNDAPYGPCLVGPTGDVALYLTHEEPRDAPAKEMQTVRDKHYGDQVTYIPSSRIKLINIRHLRVS